MISTETQAQPTTLNAFHHRSHMRNLRSTTCAQARDEYFEALNKFEGPAYANRLRDELNKAEAAQS